MVVTVIDKNDGQTRVFRGNDPAGVNMGRRTFAGKLGGFTHENVRVQLPGYPLVVIFKPDVGGKPRWEVGFENGSENVNDFTIPARILKYDYTVTVQGQDKVSEKGIVHVWGQRFRKSAWDRPLVTDIATLRAAKMVPAFKRLHAGQNSTTSSPGYKTLGLAGLTGFMGQTGERPEIGIMTEVQAEYVATQNPFALASLMAQAEAAGSWSLFFRDSRTHLPPDWVNDPFWYTDRSFYPDQGSSQTAHPVNISLKADDPNIFPDIPSFGGNHAPALGFLPYLLTGDDWHLESVEFEASMQHGSNRYKVSGLANDFTNGGGSGDGEPRAWAWEVRDFGYAELARFYETQNAPKPAAGLPIAYWQSLVKGYLAAVIRDYMNAPANSSLQPHPRFFSFCEWDTISLWEQDYVGFVLNHLSEAPVKSAADFVTLRDWKRQSNLARVDPNSGWPVLQQAWYRLYVLKDPVTGVGAKDWADLARLNSVPTDDGTGPIYQAGQAMSYIGEQVGNLGYGALLGDQKSRAGFDWLMTKLGPLASQIGWRDSVGP